MVESKVSGPSHLRRRKQFETSEKETRVTLLATMIRDFDNMIADLGEQIAAEEDRTKIKDARHPAYSTFAMAAAKRRQNLLISVARTKSMLDAAKRELDEVRAQLLDLEPIHDNPPSRTTGTNKGILRSIDRSVRRHR
jgi:flagellar FliJ protein